MALLLGWDCSIPRGSLVLAEKDSHQVIAQMGFLTLAKSSECLLAGIHALLTANRYCLQDVHGIVVGNGPGSYTGLRIAHVTASTLAQIQKLPLWKVSSLAMMAWYLKPWLQKGVAKWSMVLLNAYQNQLFVRLESACGYDMMQEILIIEEDLKTMVEEKKKSQGVGVFLNLAHDKWTALLLQWELISIDPQVFQGGFGLGLIHRLCVSQKRVSEAPYYGKPFVVSKKK